MSSIEEIGIEVELKVQNITFTQIKAAIESLEDDHVNRNMLVNETRGMELEDVGGALMLVIFKYVQAEVMNENR